MISDAAFIACGIVPLCHFTPLDFIFGFLNTGDLPSEGEWFVPAWMFHCFDWGHTMLLKGEVHNHGAVAFLNDYYHKLCSVTLWKKQSLKQLHVNSIVQRPPHHLFTLWGIVH